ncbi:MAG: NADH-quinone oxidoreductase subunit N [Actinomycetota bacterium]
MTPSTPTIVLGPVLPELVLVVAAIAVLLAGVLPRRPRSTTLLGIALAGLAVAAWAAIGLWGREGNPTVLAGAVAADRFGVLVRLVLYPVAAISLLYARHQEGEAQRPEVGALVLFATAGMSLIAIASDLIVVFLALEILSLALYVLTGAGPRLAASEAALKYFLLGSFSSAFFLFGVAMAYGATASTRLSAISAALVGTGGGRALAILAMVLLAVGFAFKVGAVPFHMWTPDVYEGAPTPVTAFMSAGTKVAAFAALARVFDVGLQPLAWDWQPVLAALAAASVVVGSLLAIAQRDVKRMLAYSSVAHAGFILTGLVLPGQDGMAASLFYLVAYAAMILGAFGVVLLVQGRGEERSDLELFRGLSKRDPLLAALLAIALLSMAGIPPAAGFVAKLGVFRAAIAADMTWLALVGVLASAAAAFFYLRLIVLMYMEEPLPGTEAPDAGAGIRATVAVPALLALVLGLVPGPVLDLVRTAAVIRW